VTSNELLTLIGIFLGPIFAVLISLWLEERRRSRDQKIIVLRMLLSTRHIPADPGFSVAINLVPVEFNRSKAVMTAYKEFIEAVQKPSHGTDTPQLQTSGAKTTKLIYEISRELGFDIRESDIQYAGYAASGWIERDQITIDSQRAMRNIAEVLWLQTRILAGEALSEQERKALGETPPSKNEEQ